MYLVYSALLAVVLVLGLPYWLFRTLRHSKRHIGLAERLGKVPDRLARHQSRPAIWVHAVSVGELIAVSDLITELTRRFPAYRVMVSTTTAAGQTLARSRFGRNSVFYFPLDFQFAIRPCLQILRPELIVIAETEFWPNFLRLAHQSGARIAIVNVLASHPRAVMILAPRRLERFDEVAQLLQQLGIRFWRRSLWSGDPISGGVLLIDSIGELASLYALGDVAFVGGSLVPKGGHNIIEPARHGVPIVVGNHTENFRDIVGLFQSRDAIRVVGPAELPLVFLELFSNEV